MNVNIDIPIQMINIFTDFFSDLEKSTFGKYRNVGQFGFAV